MVMVVAFALQSYVTQTHIHFAGQVATGGISFPEEGSKAPSGKVLGVARDHAGQSKYPPGEDPANCPICQEILYSGNYVSPTPVAVLQPPLAVLPRASIDAAEIPFVSAASHNWQGRGPPLI
jgi:hypothetical protein